MIKKEALLAIIAAVFIQYAHSQDEGMDFKTTGYFLFDMGYLNRGIDENGTPYEAFTHGAIGGGVVLTARPSDYLSLKINPEIKSYHPFPREELGGTALEQRAQWDVYMSEARADFRFGDEEKPFFYAGIGRLLYGENPDTRIFGNYLFRSMIYPGVLFTSFNNPKAQILGLQLGNNLGEGFNHNLFLTTDFNYFPYYDFSLSYQASFSFGDLFSVGGGVGFRNLLPVRPSLTSPERGDGDKSNIIVEVAPNQRVVTQFGDTLIIGSPVELGTPGAATYAFTDSSGTPGMVVTPITLLNATGDTTQDTTFGFGIQGAVFGPASHPALDQLFEQNADGKYYYDGAYHPTDPDLQFKSQALSFAGTLLSFRASINPISLLGETPLGKDAFKLYLETAVLGWKNYLTVYNERRERTPVMVGLHLPTFNWLDFLAIEVEHYPNPHFPGFQDRMDLKVPNPGSKHSVGKGGWLDSRTVDGAKQSDDWNGNKDDLKWGVAVAKSFKGFGIAAQTGVDHTKMLDKNYLDYHNVLQSSSDWYFQVRFMGGI